MGIFHRTVPADGAVAWRTSSGLTGGFYGSIAYNPFVSIQRGLVGQTDTVVFTAELDGDIDPADVYFRMLTLETYNNGKWFAGDSELSPLEDDEWEDPDLAYLGPTSRLTVDVNIEALEMEWLPAPYAPVAAVSTDRTVDSAMRVRNADASLVYKGGRTYSGMEYSVTADIPQLDPGALATGTDGALSPLFAAAAEENESVPDPVPGLESRELSDVERYLALPDDLSSGGDESVRILDPQGRDAVREGIGTRTVVPVNPADSRTTPPFRPAIRPRRWPPGSSTTRRRTSTATGADTASSSQHRWP